MLPYAFMDSPKVLDCTVTSIPGSGSPPLQVVASLIFPAAKLEINDGLGAYCGLYVGGVGVEELYLIIAGGDRYEKDVEIPHGARISLRSMSTSAISTGTLCLTFLA